MKKALIITILLCAGIAAGNSQPKDKDDGITLFAVATLPQGVDGVYLGDSIIVTVVLYSNINFEKIENKSTKIPAVKKATVRRYRAGRRLSQDIAPYKGKRYYAVAAEQYAVTPTETSFSATSHKGDTDGVLGEITFPSQQYNVVLSVTERSRDPFNPFGEFFPFGRTQTRQVQKACTSEPLKIKVAKRPRKTIEELRQSGTTVM